MRVVPRFLISLSGALLLAPSALAQPPNEEAIRRAITELGDERFAVRQRAFKLLVAAGDAAEKPLREAANGTDPEVVRQARHLLERIAYRVDPDTPADVVELMMRFRRAGAEGADQEQSEIIREMLRRGSRAQQALLRLLDVVDEKPRRFILDGFAYDDWKILGSLLAQKQTPLVEQLIDRALSAQNESIIAHYAAFQAQTGRLEAARAEFRARADKSNLAFDARVLLALCRLAEDRVGALAAARQAQDPVWVRQLLAELERWDELAREFPARPGVGSARVVELGQLAAYQRLAGRTEELAATLRLIADSVTDPGGPRANRPWLAAKALLLNERPAEALELLRTHDLTSSAADLLAGQARFPEALRLTEQAAAAESGNRYADRVLHIQLLLRLGLRPQAKEVLTRLERDLGDSTDPGWLDRSIMILVQLDDRAAAEARLAARLDRQDNSSLIGAYSTLFPRLGVRAELAGRMLAAQAPSEGSARLLERLRDWDTGRTPPADVDALLLGPVPLNPHTKIPDFAGVAALVAVLGRADVAVELLKRPNWDSAPAEARLPLADTLAQAGRWADAADAYRRIWEMDRAGAAAVVSPRSDAGAATPRRSSGEGTAGVEPSVAAGQ